MKITEVKPQKGHLVTVTLENGNTFTVSAELALEKGIKQGAPFDESGLDTLLRDSHRRRAKSRALWYLSRTDCSKGQMLEKLRRAGFPEDACAYTVSRLIDADLINDERFAARVAENLSRRSCSPRQIKAKLTEKRISPDLAAATVEGMEVDTLAQIRKLVSQKYLSRLKNPDKKHTVFPALARRGFAAGDIITVLREFDCTDDCEDDYGI